MQCVCIMGGARKCPEDCPQVVWNKLPPNKRNKAGRKAYAEKLYKGGATMEQIAAQLGVNHATISRDLQFVHNAQTSRPKGGRPKGSGKKRGAPKPHPKQAEMTALADKGHTVAEVAAETGASPHTVRRELEREQIRRETEPQITPESLSLSAQQKLEICKRQEQRRLEAAFDGRVSEKVKEFLDQWLPDYNQKLAEAERVINSHQGIMPRSHFRKILACLHPDQGMGERALSEAFNIFEKLEDLLVKKDDRERSRIPFPRTYEEGVRMKRDVAARRASKRKQNGKAVQPA